jgi:hypothetical protein
MVNQIDDREGHVTLTCWDCPKPDQGCLVCGKPLPVLRGWTHSHEGDPPGTKRPIRDARYRYCSSTCRHLAEQARSATSTEERRRLRCAWCNSLLVGGSLATYCSNRCRQAAYRDRKRPEAQWERNADRFRNAAGFGGAR